MLEGQSESLGSSVSSSQKICRSQKVIARSSEPPVNRGNQVQGMTDGAFCRSIKNLAKSPTLRVTKLRRRGVGPLAPFIRSLRFATNRAAPWFQTRGIALPVPSA
jgi:hypothetical protein